jgi:hypothetical protein
VGACVVRSASRDARPKFHRLRPSSLLSFFSLSLSLSLSLSVSPHNQLDDLTCTKAALTARLRAAQQRATKLEQVASSNAAADAAGGGRGGSGRGGLGDDPENGGAGGGVVSASGYSGGGGHAGLAGGGGRLRRRAGGGASGASGGSSIARLPQIAKHQQVAKVADAVDQWAMWMGLFLKNNAYARLYFLIYISMLHLWVFFVVTFQAHSFEEVHGDHQLQLMSSSVPMQQQQQEEQQLGLPNPDRPSGQLGQQHAGHLLGA